MSKVLIDTERNLGNTCSSRTYYKRVQNIENDYLQIVTEITGDALNNGHLIICIINDYTSVHTKCRPTEEQASKATHMATVVIHVFENIPAIPLGDIENVHNPLGIDAQLVSDHVTSDDVMSIVGNSFASSMPPSYSEQFFAPETQRRLEAHELSRV